MAVNIKNLSVLFRNAHFRIFVYKSDGNDETDTVDDLLSSAGDIGSSFDSPTEFVERIQKGDIIFFVNGTTPAVACVYVTANSGSSLTTATLFAAPSLT